MGRKVAYQIHKTSRVVYLSRCTREMLTPEPVQLQMRVRKEAKRGEKGGSRREREAEGDNKGRGKVPTNKLFGMFISAIACINIEKNTTNTSPPSSSPFITNLDPYQNANPEYYFSKKGWDAEYS